MVSAQPAKRAAVGEVRFVATARDRGLGTVSVSH